SAARCRRRHGGRARPRGYCRARGGLDRRRAPRIGGRVRRRAHGPRAGERPAVRAGAGASRAAPRRPRSRSPTGRGLRTARSAVSRRLSMNWSIRTRLVGLSALGLALLFAVGATGWWSLRRASLTGRSMQSGLQTVRDHLEMSAMNAAIRADVLTILGSRNPQERQQGVDALHSHVARLEQFSERSAHRAVDPQTLEMLQQMRSGFERAAGLAQEIAKKSELGRLGAAVNRAVESLSEALARIADNSVAVGNASEELASVSSQLQSSAVETSEQMGLATRASKETNTSVRLVAASAQQVGSGI